MEDHEFKGRWFVLYTRNKQERLVREELPFKSIVPMVERKKAKGKGDHAVVLVELEPKYPNYVFVQHDGSKNFFEACLEHKHVVSFASGNKPLPLSKAEEENIFARELSRHLEPNANVLIVDGPYKGQTGTIVRQDGDSFLVRIKIFNLDVEEVIPQEFLSTNE